MGKRIEKARKKAGLSQEELAEALGVTPPAISHWENGRHEIRPSNRKKLAKTLGVSEMYLLTGVDDTDVDENIREILNGLFDILDKTEERSITTMEIATKTVSLASIAFALAFLFCFKYFYPSPATFWAWMFWIIFIALVALSLIMWIAGDKVAAKLQRKRIERKRKI